MKTEPKQHRRSTARDSEGQHFASQGAGQALNAETRAVLEPRFGHNFGDVRVFADGQADQLAQGYQARAFTVGQDVFFAHGEYAPDSASGMGLLAHELTHTIQQRGAKFDGRPLTVSQRGDAGEREADAAASSVTSGGIAHVQASGGLSVQCFQGTDDEWRNNKDAHEQSRNVSAVQAIPGLGNIFSLGMAGAAGVVAGVDYLTDDTRAAQSGRMAESDLLKAIPFFGNDMAMRDAQRDQQAINDLESGKANKPTESSRYQRENVGIPKLNKSLEDIWNFF